MILSFENFPILADYTEGFMNPWDEDEGFPLPGEQISEEQVEWFHNFILGEMNTLLGYGIASTNLVPSTLTVTLALAAAIVTFDVPLLMLATLVITPLRNAPLPRM